MHKFQLKLAHQQLTERQSTSDSSQMKIYAVRAPELVYIQVKQLLSLQKLATMPSL